VSGKPSRRQVDLQLEAAATVATGKARKKQQ